MLLCSDTVCCTQNEKYRALVALGVAGMGTSSTASFSHEDSVRYASLSAAQLASAADAAGTANGGPGTSLWLQF